MRILIISLICFIIALLWQSYNLVDLTSQYSHQAILAQSKPTKELEAYKDITDNHINAKVFLLKEKSKELFVEIEQIRIFFWTFLILIFLNTAAIIALKIRRDKIEGMMGKY